MLYLIGSTITIKGNTNLILLQVFTSQCNPCSKRNLIQRNNNKSDILLFNRLLIRCLVSLHSHELNCRILDQNIFQVGEIPWTHIYLCTNNAIATIEVVSIHVHGSTSAFCASTTSTCSDHTHVCEKQSEISQFKNILKVKRKMTRPHGIGRNICFT